MCCLNRVFRRFVQLTVLNRAAKLARKLHESGRQQHVRQFKMAGMCHCQRAVFDRLRRRKSRRSRSDQREPVLGIELRRARAAHVDGHCGHALPRRRRYRREHLSGRRRQRRSVVVEHRCREDDVHVEVSRVADPGIGGPGRQYARRHHRHGRRPASADGHAAQRRTDTLRVYADARVGHRAFNGRDLYDALFDHQSAHRLRRQGRGRRRDSGRRRRIRREDDSHVPERRRRHAKTFRLLSIPRIRKHDDGPLEARRQL